MDLVLLLVSWRVCWMLKRRRYPSYSTRQLHNLWKMWTRLWAGPGHNCVLWMKAATHLQRMSNEKIRCRLYGGMIGAIRIDDRPCIRCKNNFGFTFFIAKFGGLFIDAMSISSAKVARQEQVRRCRQYHEYLMSFAFFIKSDLYSAGSKPNSVDVQWIWKLFLIFANSLFNVKIVIHIILSVTQTNS